MIKKRIVSIPPLNVTEIDDKNPFFSLLLLADPSENLVRDYINRGRTFAATLEGVPVGIFVLLPLGSGEWELKNIAVDTAHQGKGYGQYLLEFAINTARQSGARSLIVGTASSGTKQIRFYERAGFTPYRLDEGFFIRNYDEPVIDEGVQCIDMLYLRQTFETREAKV